MITEMCFIDDKTTTDMYEWTESVTNNVAT